MGWVREDSIRHCCAVLGCALAAHAQDPLKTLPQNYWKVFENDDVAVIHAHYGAHEKIPVHDHAGFATVFVYLSDSGPVRIDHTDDGKTESVVRPPTVTGAFRVVAGMTERHSIESLSDTSSDFLRVELKHLTLTAKDGFRGKAPASLAQSTDAVEFSDASGLEVERTICAGGAACEVKPLSQPSLLVAFHAVKLNGQELAAGAVRWVAAAQGLEVQPHAGDAPHLLRIFLPAAK